MSPKCHRRCTERAKYSKKCLYSSTLISYKVGETALVEFQVAMPDSKIFYSLLETLSQGGKVSILLIKDEHYKQFSTAAGCG